MNELEIPSSDPGCGDACLGQTIYVILSPSFALHLSSEPQETKASLFRKRSVLQRHGFFVSASRLQDEAQMCLFKPQSWVWNLFKEATAVAVGKLGEGSGDRGVSNLAKLPKCIMGRVPWFGFLRDSWRELGMLDYMILVLSVIWKIYKKCFLLLGLGIDE